jgi:hypothetical protein
MHNIQDQELPYQRFAAYKILEYWYWKGDFPEKHSHPCNAQSAKWVGFLSAAQSGIVQFTRNITKSSFLPNYCLKFLPNNRRFQQISIHIEQNL